jgi:hypothetical protein
MPKYSNDREKWRLQKRAQRDKQNNQGSQQQQPQEDSDDIDDSFFTSYA